MAGPVVAAACVLEEGVHIAGVHDSKKLNEEEREALFEALTTHPGVKYAVAVVDHKEIDEINILQVCVLAGERGLQWFPVACKLRCDAFRRRCARWSVRWRACPLRPK